MTEYIYHGFKVVYKIEPPVAENNLYKAEGYVLRFEKQNETVPTKFHTEYDSRRGAENEIKKLLEDYIDFEWKNFNEMTEEKNN